MGAFRGGGGNGSSCPTPQNIQRGEGKKGEEKKKIKEKGKRKKREKLAKIVSPFPNLSISVIWGGGQRKQHILFYLKLYVHCLTYPSGLRKTGASNVPFLDVSDEVEINFWSHTEIKYDYVNLYSHLLKYNTLK